MRSDEVILRVRGRGRLAMAGLVLAGCVVTSQAQTQAQSAPASVASSVLTVGNLVMLENAAAMKAAQRTRQDAGLSPAEPPKILSNTAALTPTVVNVDVLAILGTQENLRAHLSVEGQTFDNAVPGTSVRGCVVELITPRCVAFISPVPDAAPAKSTATKGKGKSTQSSSAGLVCPQACWTGIRRPPVMMPGAGDQAALVGAPGKPLPMPSPVVNVPTPAAQVQTQVQSQGPGTRAIAPPSSR